MVSSASQILDSGYTLSLCKSYTGTSTLQRMWYAYPDDTDWYWSDAHGNLPSTKTCSFSFSKSKYADWDVPYKPSIVECSFVSKFNGFQYDVSVTNTWVKTFSKCASMKILSVCANNTSCPGDTEIVTIDIDNKGGDGKFDIIILDNGVEIDSALNRSVSDSCAVREMLEFMMLNRDMELTIQLVDLYDNTVVDELTYVIQVCDPTSPTPEDPDMLDVIMDNKEIIIIGAIVGAIVLKSV